MLQRPERLDKLTREIVQSPDNDVFFSAASIWKIAIKCSLGRADFAVRPELIAPKARTSGFMELPISAHNAARVADLPLHHRGPFDRLLVAQAMAAPMNLYTADLLLSAYSPLIQVVA